MDIVYSDTAEGLAPEQLQGFFVGWPEKPSAETLLTLLKKSTYIVLAKDGNSVVGFVTAISDGVLASYIPFLEVLPEYQNKGIGSELVKRILEKLKDLYMVDLLCDADMQSFYEKFGMKKATGMMIRNYKNQAGL